MKLTIEFEMFWVDDVKLIVKTKSKIQISHMCLSTHQYIVSMRMSVIISGTAQGNNLGSFGSIDVIALSPGLLKLHTVNLEGSSNWVWNIP